MLLQHAEFPVAGRLVVLLSLSLQVASCMQQLEPSRSGYKPESKCELNCQLKQFGCYVVADCIWSLASCLRDCLMHLFATANSCQSTLRLSQTNRLDQIDGLRAV